MWDDGVPTVTSQDQLELEGKVRALYSEFVTTRISDGDPRLHLRKLDHANYLYGGLGDLPAGFSSLDASRPWICYWILHSLALLEQPLPDTPSRQSIIEFLAACQHPDGGFGGGPYQLSHLATTYAAVSALVTLGGEDALSVIDRPALFNFFLAMCVPRDQGGGMRMHDGGEVDIRGCYCALASCYMLNLDVNRLADACSLTSFVSSCQSMEGGLGGEPGNEAHGGYTFCGFAALMFVNRPDAIDVHRLTAWVCRMQGWMEGGFAGRTCKLVDGCYSLWQGGIFPLLEKALAMQDPNTSALQGVAAQADAKKLEELMNRLASLTDLNEFELMKSQIRPALSPFDNAISRAKQAQERIDAAVEDSLRLEEEYQKECLLEDSKHAEVSKADALMALEEASAAQDALEKAEEHAQSAACSATTILKDYYKNNPQYCDHSSTETQYLQSVAADNTPLYDPLALQLWLLVCCQVAGRGGLRDKPGKGVDYYHTCYCLSGLSSAQHWALQHSGESENVRRSVLGGEVNLLKEADALCNVIVDKVQEAQQYFREVTTIV